LLGVLTVIVALLALVPLLVSGQAPAATSTAAANTGSAPRTPWGDPDLQGIWTDEYQTPLQRPAKFAGRELLTDEEVAALDRQRGALLGREYRDRNNQGKGTEQDVAGAYNAVFTSVKRSSHRTSLIVDPSNGRIPAYAPEAKQRMDAYREFQLALLQATETCKNQAPSCRGGKYGPPSPRRAERPPIYNTDRLNRTDDPEDRSMTERCMAAQLPDFGGFRRIVQDPGSVSIFYDVGQGQAWQRVIPITTRPHLPSTLRQWWGDSRGRWEGNTLVVDVTNFTAKLDFRGSRENLHLVERWTPLDANTLEYVVTIEDPTTWTAPWTVEQEMKRQSEQGNRIYYEPRCHEGNHGLVGMLVNTRAEERAFAEGRGPDPATRDTALAGPGGGEENADPLGGGL
jgi:hypothetical protein